MLKEPRIRNAGIIGQIEVIRYYIKLSYTQNTQYAAKFFNSEVICTWISLCY